MNSSVVCASTFSPVFLAAAPTVDTTRRLAQVWRELSQTGGVFAGSVGDVLAGNDRG